MAIHNLRITRVEYNDVSETMQLVMHGEPLPAPEGVREDLWYPSAASFNVVVPVKKGAFTLPSGIYIEPGSGQRYKVSYTGTGWTTPVPVNEQGV